MGAIAEWLFDPAGVTAHGFCLLWEPGLIWAHAVADALIGVAYFTTPAALLVFARRRRDLAFGPVLGLFAAFILLCGSGHWIDLLTLWVPVYGLQAVVKVATATVSLMTAAMLWRMLPQLIALPSPAQLHSANEALRESEQRHRTTFERSPVPMHALDRGGIVTAVSDSWLALLGYERGEVLGRPLADFRLPEDHAAASIGWARLLATGELRDVERRFRRRDGTLVETLVSARLESDEPDAWAVCVVIDISARRRAEEALRASEDRLRQSQKMEAIGQLTSGVAHDFNNVLTAVMGNLELIRMRAGEGRSEILRYVEQAIGAARRAAGLTAQLLSFSRRQRLEPMALDPVAVVEDLLPLLARSTGQRIALTVDPEGEVGLCLADRNQLESALLNLVNNARDAIPGAGRIVITLAAVEIGQDADDWPPAGCYVRIAVRDNGVGMPEEVRRRAFEPFFTTKGPGEGSGLGLAQIHGFAHQSGGTATIESEPGVGTEVALLMPGAEPVGMKRPAAELELAPVGRGETVLLVEDDEGVRSVLADMLTGLGYRVVEAKDGGAALHLLREGMSVQAMLTDLTMPGELDGIELAHAARRRQPDLPVVLATGHLDPLVERKLPPGVAFLQKPCGRANMAQALARVLGAAAIA